MASHAFTEEFENESGLLVRTYYLQCMAQATYIVADRKTKSAFLVDPRRDVDLFLNEIKELGLQLKGVFITHMHADFVSGHLEVCKRVGCPIFVSRKSQVLYPHYPVEDGELLRLGDYRVRCIETPGHTPGCISFVVQDATGKALHAFTGDTLFVGSVGRPDLLGSVGFKAEDLAATLYSSLNEKILKLPDECLVHPAHGAGSPCGKSLGKELHSTIGNERATNPALQFSDVESFVAYVLDGQPAAPQYFLTCVGINKVGAPALEETLFSVKPLKADAFSGYVCPETKEGAEADAPVVIDTRDADEYAAGHIPRSVNFPIGVHAGVELTLEEGNFAIWVGTLLHPSTNILLVTPEGKERESIERLARVGFHNVIGYLEGGFPSWKTGEDQWGYAYKVDSFERVRLSEASDLQALVDDEDVVLVDFRTGHEFDCPTNGHVKGAIKMPLGELPARLAELDATKRYVTYCSGGFRSTIGVGFMLHKGLKVTDIDGGYKGAILPLAKSATTAAAE